MGREGRFGGDRICLPVRVQRNAATALRGARCRVWAAVRTIRRPPGSNATERRGGASTSKPRDRRNSSDCDGRAVLKRHLAASYYGAVQCPHPSEITNQGSRFAVIQASSRLAGMPREFTAQNKLEALHAVVQMHVHWRRPENRRCYRAIRRAKLQPDRHCRPNQCRC